MVSRRVVNYLSWLTTNKTSAFLIIGSMWGLAANYPSPKIAESFSVCHDVIIHHDDVIKLKHFPCYWPFVRGTTGHLCFPSQRPVTPSFDVFFDVRLNKRLRKQSKCWWLQTPPCSLWRHTDDPVVVQVLWRAVHFCVFKFYQDNPDPLLITFS